MGVKETQKRFIKAMKKKFQDTPGETKYVYEGYKARQSKDNLAKPLPEGTKGFGGLFNTVDAKILEIMISDPGREYAVDDFDFVHPADVKEALWRLYVRNLVFRPHGGYYTLNCENRVVVALHLLALAQRDDQNGTHYMDAQVKAWFKPVWDPPV